MTESKTRLKKIIEAIGKDKSILNLLQGIENIVAKVLSLALSVVILVATFDLIVVLAKDVIQDPMGFYTESLIELFGLFLNILIALELLENTTAYLKKHIVQVELVIVTSLIAIARKIIIFDFQKYSSTELAALGIAILALAVSYWLIKRLNLDKD
ncbi:phosphate-starvation-inducible PsiE family protein [Myxosarcina sp. GI1(2024)]